MNFKLVLKTYSQLRQLSDDESALLELLRGMTDAERELLTETLGPPVKAKSSKTQPKKTRVIEHCIAEGCGMTRRAVVHKDTTTKGYHEFQQSKSKRAISIAEKVTKSPRVEQPFCCECNEYEDHPNHDLENGGHEFTTDVTGRLLQLTSPERCYAIRDDGKPCGLLPDHNVHHMKSVMGHHEFVGEQAQAAGGS